jgi:hypothetical protein
MQDANVFEKQAKPDFQKLAGGGFASAIPICFLLKANWYENSVRRHCRPRARLRRRAYTPRSLEKI